MVTLPSVTRAEYRGGHTIHVTFDDGLAASIDFSPWLVGSIFEPLRESDAFARFSIEGGTIAWPNGADIAPETLHARAKANAVA